MKNRTLLLLALSIILSSCATTNRYASTSFEDAIYQQPNSDNYLVVNTNVDKELEVLRGKTQESNRIMIDGKVVEAVYADEQGNVDINADDNTTYVILNPGESFEERLSKFDNPNYTININYVDEGFYDPWYGFMPYRAYRNSFWRYRWYSAWDSYNWGRWSNFGYYSYWHDPYFSWHSPFYSYYHGYWNMPYYDYYHRPNYGWSGYTNYGRGRVYSNRDRYYGRRVSPRNNNSTNRRAISGGSYNRRDVRTSQIRGTSISHNSNDINKRYSESIYRRDGRDNNTRLDNRVKTNKSTANRNQSTTTNRSTNYQRRTNSSTNTTGTNNNINRRSTGSVNRTSTGTVNRRSTGSVNRTSTGTVNRRSTGTVNKSSTGTRSNSSVRRSGSTTSSSSRATSTSQYRRATTSTVNKNNNSSTTRNSSYQGNSRSTSTRSTYSPPTRSTTSSSSSSRSSSSSSSSSSRSSSGSRYRR